MDPDMALSNSTGWDFSMASGGGTVSSQQADPPHPLVSSFISRHSGQTIPFLFLFHLSAIHSHIAVPPVAGPRGSLRDCWASGGPPLSELHGVSASGPLQLHPQSGRADLWTPVEWQQAGLCVSTACWSPGAEAGRPLGTMVWPNGLQVSGCLSPPDLVLCGGRQGSVSMATLGHAAEGRSVGVFLHRCHVARWPQVFT